MKNNVFRFLGIIFGFILLSINDNIIQTIALIHLLGDKKTYFDFSKYLQHKNIKLKNYKHFYIFGSGKVIETYKINNINEIKNIDYKDADMIEIFDPDIHWDISYKHPQGEIHEINNFNIDNTFYKYNNIYINLIKSIKNVSITNIHFIGLSRKIVSLIGIHIRYGLNINIAYNFIYKFDYHSLSITSCLNSFLYRNKIAFEEKGLTKVCQYAINFQNSSRNGYVYDNIIYRGKHSLLTGHMTSLPGIQRDLYFVKNICIKTWHASLACHAACERLMFFNNIVFGSKFGVNIRVPRCIVQSNILLNTFVGFYIL